MVVYDNCRPVRVSLSVQLARARFFVAIELFLESAATARAAFFLATRTDSGGNR